MPTSNPNVLIDGVKMGELRKLLGETQAVFAQRAGISPAYVSQIEKQQRKYVSPPMFARICDALGIAVEDRAKMIADPPPSSRLIRPQRRR